MAGVCQSGHEVIVGFPSLLQGFPGFQRCPLGYSGKLVLCVCESFCFRDKLGVESLEFSGQGPVARLGPCDAYIGGLKRDSNLMYR